MPTPAVNAADHLDWAAGIARKYARRYQLRDQEAADIVSEARVALYELIAAGGFDRARAVDADLGVSFRVFAYKTVACACRRAVEGLRGGGTFRTIRPELLFAVNALGDTADLVAIDPPTLPVERPDVAPLAVPSPAAVPYGRLARRLTA